MITNGNTPVKTDKVSSFIRDFLDSDLVDKNTLKIQKIETIIEAYDGIKRLRDEILNEIQQAYGICEYLDTIKAGDVCLYSNTEKSKTFHFDEITDEIAEGLETLMLSPHIRKINEMEAKLNELLNDALRLDDAFIK